MGLVQVDPYSVMFAGCQWWAVLSWYAVPNSKFCIGDVHVVSALTLSEKQMLLLKYMDLQIE